MANFYWSAKDRFGNQSIREVAANTLEESRQILLAEGCTDLELKEDDVMATAQQGFPKKTTVLGEEVKVPALDKFKYQSKPPITFSRAIRESVFKDKGFTLMLLAGAIIAAYTGHKILAIGLGVGCVSWFAFVVSVSLPGIYYTRLYRATEWHRWTEVLDLVETSKQIRQMHFIKIPLVELQRHRAIALAGLGRLPEALEEYKRCENQPGCPSWLYHAQLAGILDTAKQHDNALEHTEKSIELKPTPTIYVDLAHRLLHYKRDVVGAKEALAKIDTNQLIDLGKPFLLRCYGILAYLEGNHDVARKHLEEALGFLEARKGLPYRDSNMSLIRGYLSCVLAKQGDLNGARSCFSQAEAYLVTAKSTGLLEECKQVFGARI